MNKDQKQQRFIRLMDEQLLSALDVSIMLNRSESRVFGWRSAHEIPDHMLELFEIKVKKLEEDSH